MTRLNSEPTTDEPPPKPPPKREQRQPSNTPFTKLWPRPKKKPETSYGTTPGTSFSWLLRPILCLIDWLNRLVGAEKP